MARAVRTDTLEDEAVREALEHIAANLRPADLAEMRALQGPDMEDPYWTLIESLENSAAAWLILDRTGLPIGIFGVAAHLVAGLGMAWLIGTEGVEHEALSIARQTPGYVAEMQRYFPILWAFVDARNALSMRWLEWAGFQITDANPNAGAENRLFIDFVRTR